ncbi:hypothetical protein GW17_00036740 [Ensete ventricosum]|nr:hypothetical protein GW17_00036740 [Ensete ventricosum]
MWSFENASLFINLSVFQVNSYPTDRRFTAIGTGGDEFVQAMVVAVESVIQEPIPKVQAVYNAMRRDDRMKYFL